MNTIITALTGAIETLNEALVEEVEKHTLTADYQQMIDNSPSDLAARYWLMEFLNFLNRKELKSVVDGFLVQLLNEEQAKKLVKFLLVRYPQYYVQDASKPMEVNLLDDEEDDRELPTLQVKSPV